jgi:hypothetical protein
MIVKVALISSITRAHGILVVVVVVVAAAAVAAFLTNCYERMICESDKL